MAEAFDDGSFWNKVKYWVLAKKTANLMTRFAMNYLWMMRKPNFSMTQG